MMQLFRPRSTVGWILLIATVVFAIANIAYGMWHQASYETHAYDSGIFGQALWHLSRFEAPASTVRDVTNLFGDHFSPILISLVPFAWVFPPMLVLIVAQALALAALVPVTYALARQLGISRWPSVLLAITAGMAPGLAPALGFDVHEIAFAVPLLPLAALLAERRRWAWYSIVVLLLLLTKESLGVYVTMIGVLLLIRRQWRAGLVTAAVGITAAAVIIGLVLPMLNPSEGFRHWDRYRALAASPGLLPFEIFTHPFRFISAAFDHPQKIGFMAAIIGGTGLLSVLGVAALPLLAMSLVEVVWSSFPPEWSFGFHYALLPTSAATIATCYGVAWIQKRQPKFAIPFASMAIVGALTVHFFTPSIRILWRDDIWQRPTATWNAEFKKIPSHAAVSASDAFVPHLTARQIIYRYPRIREAQWIVLDPKAPSYPLQTDQVVREQELLKNDPQWTLARAVGSLTVFYRQNSDWIPDRPDDPATKR